MVAPALAAPESFTGADTGRSARRIPYQPSLDGLRGVAVAAVLVFHGGLSWMTGGFLGVDTFFVLSGFLITTLLVTEYRGDGSIALGRFWIHRARRLLPALAILLIGIAAYAVWLASPDALDQLRWDSLSSLFYVANWRFVASDQSYFDQFFVSPLRHTWSLAIEEQYYLLWPLVVLALLRWFRSNRVLLVVTAVLAIGSAGLMAALFTPDADPSRLYYGTDTHAQSLLVGSALAAAVASGLAVRGRLARNLVAAGALVAGVLVLVAFARVRLATALLYRGGFLAFALCVALVIFACTQLGPNPLRAALSFEPLRRLGLISYGVYLYHWPIFLVLDADRTGLSPGLGLFVLRIAVTIAVATASYVLVERPIRDGALERLGLPAYLAPVALLALTFVLVAVTAGARRSTLTPGDLDAAKRPPPSLATPSAGAPDATRVLLVGDSVAYTLGVGFEGEVSDKEHLAVWNQAVLFCELVPGPRRENGEVRPASDTCRNWEQDWRDDVAIFRPDVTMLMVGAWEIFDREVDGRWLEFGTPEYDAVLEPVLQRAVDALSSGGARVVVPTTPRFARAGGASAQEWTQNDVARTDHFNELLRRLAARNPDTVVLVDLAEFVCPGRTCPSEINGVRMRTDGVHYHDSDAVVVAEWLSPRLRAAARAPGEPAAGNPVAGPPGSAPPGTAGR